jgi:spore maturation protein CgeB
MERVVTINALASAIKDRYTLDLYTDNADDKLRGVRVKSFVDYKKTMPKVFNNSKINLNISLRNIRSGIPLRVWDVLGSGGFLLSNRQIEIRDYFIEGKEIECYSTIEEAVTKTLYYLEHDEERIKIAQNGLEKVEKEHSYDRRIEEILDIVKKEKQNKYM